jgi:hypothetical protein
MSFGMVCLIMPRHVRASFVTKGAQHYVLGRHWKANNQRFRGMALSEVGIEVAVCNFLFVLLLAILAFHFVVLEDRDLENKLEVFAAGYVERARQTHSSIHQVLIYFVGPA